MMVMPKTDRQLLLAAVRKGDFGALAALMDLLREADPEFVEREWDRRLDWMRARIMQSGRTRVSLTEWARRSMKGVLLALNRHLKAGWRIPPMRSRQWRAEPLYSRTCQLRDGMIRLVKATG